MPVCFRSSKEKKAKVPRKIAGVTESIVRVIYGRPTDKATAEQSLHT